MERKSFTIKDLQPATFLKTNSSCSSFLKRLQYANEIFLLKEGSTIFYHHQGIKSMFRMILIISKHFGQFLSRRFYSFLVSQDKWRWPDSREGI